MLYHYFKNNRVITLPQEFISSLWERSFEEQCNVSHTWKTKNKNNWAHLFLILGKDRKVLPSSYTVMRNLHNSYRDDEHFKKMMRRVLNAKNSSQKNIWHLFAEDFDNSFGLLNEFISYYGIEDVNAKTSNGFSMMDLVFAKLMPTDTSFGMGKAIEMGNNENLKNCFLNLVSLSGIDWNGGRSKSLRNKIYLLPKWAKPMVVPALDKAVLENKIPEAKESLKKLKI